MVRLFRCFPIFFLLAAFLAMGWGAAAPKPVAARAETVSAYDLIDAVNRLRNQHGLSGYSTNSILMNVAQAQSDYQAAIGSVTHYGPGGTRPYQRALAAGYPVGGDLSLGGFYSENIMGGPGLTVQSVVNAWMGDAPHQNTMLSANLTEVGAGVSCSGDYCYFTLDASTPGGSSVSYTPSVGSTPGTGPGFVTAVVVLPNTPDSDGSVKHVVQQGETLSTIGGAYHVSVDNIKKLNKLSNDMIYVGQTLIIKQPVPTATLGPTDTPTPNPTYTPFIFWTVTPSPTVSATPIPSAPIAQGSGTVAVAIIVVAALVLSGVFTASGFRKRK